MLQEHGGLPPTPPSNTSTITCPLCGKQLSGRNGKQKLQYHMLTHTGEKPFSCPHCPYRASLKFNLVSHVRNIHKIVPPSTSPRHQLSPSSSSSCFSLSPGSFVSQSLMAIQKSLSSPPALPHAMPFVSSSSATSPTNAERSFSADEMRTPQYSPNSDKS